MGSKRVVSADGAKKQERLVVWFQLASKRVNGSQRIQIWSSHAQLSVQEESALT